MRIVLSAFVTLALAAPPAPPPEAKFRPFNGTPTKGDYTVYVSDVHDSDSFTGCLLLPIKIRVHGVNGPELSQAGGAAGRDYLRGLILGKQLDARFYGTEKFGRVLGDLNINGVWLSDKLIEAGHAKKWDGHGPRP